MHCVQSKDGFMDIREVGGFVYEAKVLKMKKNLKRRIKLTRPIV